MKIEKFIHSCLRVTIDGQQLLFDPGKFSFREGRVAPDELVGASVIVVTHDHPDHLDIEALRIIAGGSTTPILANAQLASKLREAGLNATVDGDARIGAFEIREIPTPHAPILSKEVPATSAYLVNGRLLNVSDSLDASLHALAGVEILALPVMAPFATELDVYRFVKVMCPRHLIPLHDGYARDFFVEQRYDTYQPFFEEIGVTFHRLAQPGDHVVL